MGMTRWDLGVTTVNATLLAPPLSTTRGQTLSQISPRYFFTKFCFLFIHVTSIRIFFAWGYVCLFYIQVPQRSENRASVAVKTGLYSIYDILAFSEFPLKIFSHEYNYGTWLRMACDQFRMMSL